MREPKQMIAGGTAGLQRGGVKQRSDVAERAAQTRIGPAVDERGAGIRRVQAENYTHRRGFTRAIRADESGYLARGYLERHSVQRQRGPEPLSQLGYLNGGFHVRKAREAGMPRSSRRGAAFV